MDLMSFGRKVTKELPVVLVCALKMGAARAADGRVT